MVFATVALIAALLAADARGASLAVAGLGWPFAFPGDTAQKMAQALVGVDAAFVALYFSITLLVLTLASSSLGVRLIDRWISARITRLTLGLLLSGLAGSLIALAAVDANASGEHVPRLTILTLLVLTLNTMCWLAFALHDLGRKMHIDTDIAALTAEAVDCAEDIGRVDPPAAMNWGAATIIEAPRNGYIEGAALEKLAAVATELDGRIRVVARIGAYVMTGDPIARFSGPTVSADVLHQLARQFCIGRYRGDAQGATFHVRLLVEIAARALSPAVNDFYTARACVDALGPIMIAHARLPQGPAWLGDQHGAPRVLVVADPFHDLFDGPLKSLRQSAAAYPGIAIRLCEMLQAVIDRSTNVSIRQFLVRHRTMIADHAAARSDYELDREAILGSSSLAELEK